MPIVDKSPRRVVRELRLPADRIRAPSVSLLRASVLHGAPAPAVEVAAAAIDQRALAGLEHVVRRLASAHRAHPELLQLLGDVQHERCATSSTAPATIPPSRSHHCADLAATAPAWRARNASATFAAHLLQFWRR